MADDQQGNQDGWSPPPQQPQQPQQPEQPQQPPAPGGWNAGPQQPPAQGGWNAGSQPGYPGAYPPPPSYPGAYPPPQPGYPGAYPPMGYAPPAYLAYPRYAGFWIRFVAIFIDVVIWSLALLVAGISIVVLVGIVLFPLVLFGYWPFLWWKRGATFGQSALGLRVVRAIDGGPIDGGMAAIRAIVFWVEIIFSGWLIGLLGFVWAAFEPRKRAWHDMAAGTVVVHVN